MVLISFDLGIIVEVDIVTTIDHLHLVIVNIIIVSCLTVANIIIEN